MTDISAVPDEDEKPKKRTDQVFGMSNTVLVDSYVDRGSLDSEVAKLIGRKVHIAIRGPSKCGKSWLRQRAVRNALTVQCRLGFTVIDIYINALSQLGIKLVIDEVTKTTFRGKVEGQAEFGNDLIGKVGGSMSFEAEAESGGTFKPLGQNISDLQFIAALITASGKRLVVEDVHYLSAEQKEVLAYDLKTLWDYGCFTVVVGVWGVANMFVDLNSDLSGRIEEIPVEWMPDDLRRIIEAGSQVLKINFCREIQNKAIVDCFGNAGLLQRLILKTLDEAGLTTEQAHAVEIDQDEHYEAAAMAVAEQLNGVYLKFAERIAAGIRTRNDSTGIYAHTMAVIIEAEDIKHLQGISVDEIYEIAHSRQPRIGKANLKTILAKIDGLQVDTGGRGLVVTYDPESECVLNVDRQLLFYRKYRTLKWPFEELVEESLKMA